MASSLLTTKLYIPPVRPGLVSRPRLIERLNAGLNRNLTLISAPAGFGKTTLLAGWLQHLQATQDAERAVAWLSVDEGDADPARFFAYLVAALQQVDPSIGQTAQAMLQGPQPPPLESLVTALINDVVATPRPFILILDDYHVIDALPIHQLLAFLLEHQPPQMHLVIATREDPPLPLSRLRARGQASEIRQDDLRFTEEEAANFLQRVTQADLLPQDVAALQRRTEGWITALQLAALSTRGHDDVQQLIESFTGSHRHVLDYLIEEVFQRQSAGVQDFLLKTSILDRFTASLCDAVCSVGTGVAGRDDSRQMLLALEQANLFLVPLDESRQWYRYHRLVGGSSPITCCPIPCRLSSCKPRCPCRRPFSSRAVSAIWAWVRSRRRPVGGGMLSQGRDYMRQAPWTTFFPGLAIFVTVMAFNLLGDGLRDALDPRLRGR